jgi:predicted DNA-binding transcriptional regulator YafY
MGQRSTTETVVTVLQAFLHKRSWRQAELARHVDVTVAALRKHLNELSASGFPLVREDDHPHVWWSVPKDWFPGAVIFDSESVPELLRQLTRLPRSAARDRLIRRILEAAPRKEPSPTGAPTVLTRQSTESEESYLPLAEDAANRRICLEFKYFTMSRGTVEWRHASVQRVVIGPPARIVAVCHRDGALKWFRLDNVLGARLDDTVPHRTVDAAAVESMLKESVDGFHQGGAVRCAFFVRAPESRWVEHNLPGSMTTEVVPGGLRFSTTTAGVLRLARHVVGLGAAAHAETPELALLVAELARGALSASSAPSTSNEACGHAACAGRGAGGHGSGGELAQGSLRVSASGRLHLVPTVTFLKGPNSGKLACFQQPVDLEDVSLRRDIDSE